MGNMTKALVFIMLVNALFILVQAATLDINPDAAQFYDCTGDAYAGMDQNACNGGPHTLIIANTSELPSVTNTVTPGTGDIFTDTYASIKSWFSSTTGFGYYTTLLGGPSRFLTAMNLPSTFVFVLSAFWYAITLIVIIAFIKGGDS
jgi:hypothetical protein